MRALYLSHTGMTEPLGQSQVLPYVRGLARAGWRIDLVGFEPPTATRREIERVRDELAPHRIHYEWARRSPSHALATKLGESALALARLIARVLTDRPRPRIVHARSYLPAAVADVVASLAPGVRLLFDCRGLLGDEYVDAGHWSRTSFRYRLVKRFERRLFGRAAGVVTLTERLRGWLRDQRLLAGDVPVEVIPCCVDLQRFVPDAAARAATRARLGAGERFVVAYSGSLNSWYCEPEMARFFAHLRRQRPSLLAVFTRAPDAALRAALRAAGVPDEEVVITPAAPSEMPGWLAGADAALSFIRPCFSKMASSPTKVAEYLAMGLPVVINRGVGDQDALLDHPAVVDAGALTDEDLQAAAAALPARAALPGLSAQARQLARARFCVEGVGVSRYVQLYERLAS